jgi:hypothetical protein
MAPLVTPKDWLQVAINARAVAVRIDDPVAREMMEGVADECELIAQELGGVIDLLVRAERAH